MKGQFKTYIIFLIAFGSGSLSYSQNATVNPTKMNTFYVGIKNPIDVIVENTSCDSIWISTNNGTISHYEDCSYFITPSDRIPTYISVYVLSGNDSILINRFSFRVKSVPKPTVSISGSKKGEISKAQLSASKRLHPEYKDLIIHGIPMSVLRFSVILIRENSVLTMFENQGSKFTTEWDEAVSSLQKGDHIIIFNIKGTVAKTNKEWEPIELTIK